MYVIMILFIASNHLRQLSRVRSNAMAIGACAAVLAVRPQLGDLQRMWHECIMYHDISKHGLAASRIIRRTLSTQGRRDPSDPTWW